MTDNRRSLADAFAMVMRRADAERIANDIHDAVRHRPDTLSLARAFQAAGIERDAADRIAIEIFEAIRLAKLG